jgi:hypothetical protein
MSFRVCLQSLRKKAWKRFNYSRRIVSDVITYSNLCYMCEQLALTYCRLLCVSWRCCWLRQASIFTCQRILSAYLNANTLSRVTMHWILFFWTSFVIQIWDFAPRVNNDVKKIQLYYTAGEKKKHHNCLTFYRSQTNIFRWRAVFA